MENRKVISTLRAMEVGQVEMFPLTQKVTVANTICDRLYIERKNGMSWTYSSDKENGVLSVKRVS